MSLVKRNIIFKDGTTDGFQLIPQPARAPLGGVAVPEKSDDAVPLDYFLANTGAGGVLPDIQTTRNASIDRLLSGGGTGADIVVGQGYVFDGLAGALPNEISMIRVQGTYNLTGKGYVEEAWALSTVLSKWVKCNYDIVTNEIVLKIRGYKVSLTQTQLRDDMYFGAVNPIVIPAFGAGTFVAITKAFLLGVLTVPFNHLTNVYLIQNDGTNNPIGFTTINPFLNGDTFMIPIALLDATLSSYDDYLMDKPTIIMDLTEGTPSTVGNGEAFIYTDFNVLYKS